LTVLGLTVDLIANLYDGVGSQHDQIFARRQARRHSSRLQLSIGYGETVPGEAASQLSDVCRTNFKTVAGLLEQGSPLRRARREDQAG
jgi:hypothetical protein